MQMDFSLETPQERKEKVDEILANTPEENLTPAYLEKLADYIIFAMDKQEKKDKKILTDNRMVTVNRRETSYEGLVDRLEHGGEDAIFNMIVEPDKAAIFQHSTAITPKDLQEIRDLKSLRDSILLIEKAAKDAGGKRAFLLKKQAIEMRQDQYLIKNAYRQPIHCMNLVKSFSKLDLSEHIFLDENDDVQSDGIISLYNEQHISLLLCNYSQLKEDSYSDFDSDTKWLLMDLENIIDAALEEKHPVLYDILILKIDGETNLNIRSYIQDKYGTTYTVEYISSLWRKKIPHLIAEEARKQWLNWHFMQEEKGHWKKCSKCKQIKLAHKSNFSKNTSSKDGFYSICKECRKTKKV